MSIENRICEINLIIKNPKPILSRLFLSLTLISILFFFSSFSAIQNSHYFPNAYGHALPVTYSPEPNSIITKKEPLPSKIIIGFSERPDPKVSYIQVLDSNNKRVDNNDFKITGQQNDRVAEITLDTHKLTDGVYTVSWLTMSADDGHIARGSYVFGIGNVGGAPVSKNTLTSSLGNNNNRFAQQNQAKTETVTSNVDGLIKWPLIVAQAAIVGGIISHLFLWTNNKFIKKILYSTLAENGLNNNVDKDVKHENNITRIGNTDNQIEKNWFKPLKIFVILLCTSSVFIFAFGTALLFLQISDLSNSTSNFFIIFGTLLHGSVGTVWIVRSLASIVVIVTSLFYYFLEKKRIKRELKGNHNNQKINNNSNTRNNRKPLVFFLYIALVAGAVSIFANSMTSHSSAVTFLPSIALSLDWLHFMAVSVWVGGLFYISTVLLTLVQRFISNGVAEIKSKSKDMSTRSPDTSRENAKDVSFSKSTKTSKNSLKLNGDYFLALLLPRFSLLATISLGIIGVSGLYMAWINLHSFNALFDTSYGNILIIKLLTALPMVIIGGYHQLKLHNYTIKIASLARDGVKEENTKKQTSFFSSKNMVLGNIRSFNFKNRLPKATEKYKDNDSKISGKDYTHDVYSRFSKTIKIESLIGIAVLFVASILTITSPPGSMNMSSSMMTGNEGMNMNTNVMHQNQSNSNNNGQKATNMVMPSVPNNLQTSSQKIANNSYSNETKIMDTNTKFQINPFYTGFNTFKITFTGEDGKPAKNISSVIIQFTNNHADIGPIVVSLNKISEGVYSIFGGYISQKGNWTIQLTGQRIGAYDLNYQYSVNIKQQPPISPTTVSSPSESTIHSSQPQKLSTLGTVDNNNMMNQSESLPSFDWFAILAIVLSGLVIFGSAYYFKKNKQQLKEAIEMFEKQDKE